VREVLDHPAVREKFATMLDRLASENTGSSTLVVRATLLDEPPSIDAGELTDKGSINQKGVLANRSALVEELYASSVPSHVLVTRVQPTNRGRSSQGHHERREDT